MTILTDNFSTSLIILFLSIMADLIFGEPPPRFHPTVWMGRIIDVYDQKINRIDKRRRMLSGIIFVIALIALFTFSYHVILFNFKRYWVIGYLILSIFLLKSTFAIKSMESHTVPIAEAIRNGRIDEARVLLSRVSRREVKGLDSRKIVSGSIEAIAEGSVDGIVSPLFYFSFLNIPGAVAYRVINTLDSMIGYKDEKHLRAGWFASRLDTIVNFIPARLVAMNIGIIAVLKGQKFSSFLKVVNQFKDETDSLNAGWPISAMAAILDVKLEKPGFYRIGYSKEKLSWRHINEALKVMKQTTILSILLMVIPVMILMEMLPL